MTREELFKILSDHQDDYVFEYRGKKGGICIFENEIIAGYDGSEISFKNVAEVMSTPFINGETLNEIAPKIILYG